MTMPTDELAPDDLRAARGQMLLSSLAILMMGLALYLGYELLHPDDGLVGRGCSAETEADVCEENEHCVHGTCQRVVDWRLPCQEGAACDDSCTCDGEFACDAARVCTAQRQDRCSPETEALLGALARLERESCTAADGKRVAQCEARDLEKFLMDHQDFQRLLSGFQNTITVHFAHGQPDPSGLPTRHRQYYAEQFERIAPKLRAAAHIIVVGRASPGTNRREQQRNFMYSQARIEEVSRWIVRLGETPQAAESLERKQIALAIGDIHQLDRELFAGRPTHHYIAWHRASTDELRAWIADPSAMPGRASELSEQLNRSVFIVPVPCRVNDPSSERSVP